MTTEIDCYWWNDKPNFGDCLTKLILETYGLNARHTAPHLARLVCVGSIMELLPQSFTGTIIGAGFIATGPTMVFPNAEILALRGPLSKYRASVGSDVMVGDLGLLAHRLVSKGVKRHRIGLIPHYADLEQTVVQNLVAENKTDLHLIDVRDEPSAVLCDIAQSAMIISSSLHGLIVADALGIDSVWAIFSDKIIGSGFKFYDHNLAVHCLTGPAFLRGDESADELRNLAPRLPADAKKVQHDLDQSVSMFASRLDVKH